MHPTFPLDHLASVTAMSNADGAIDDMKIYEFDREASMDLFIAWTHTAPGRPLVAFDEVLAA
ncbi:hypothetical protein C8D87_107213 [Lentzea atacamensis]|uniref:Uncharacterized protein n=1 Tax=Lentzea atacamensis TaxID=531938 RepID=A0ABX9E635_9PSEU|nr:hypothetical protein C8D87_107213 [Lentzea atacamensis]